MDIETIEINFCCDRTPTSDKVDRCRVIMSDAKSLALTIEGMCPDSREKSLAMTRLEEAVMWANAAIMRDRGGEAL